MQVQLTPEAKIASDFLFIRAIFAVVGFVSALKPRFREETGLCHQAGSFPRMDKKDPETCDLRAFGLGERI